MSISQHIGGRIKAARRKANISQAQLGQKTGLGQSMISRIEKGDRVPSAELLARIASVLDVAVSELMPSINIDSIAKAQNIHIAGTDGFIVNDGFPPGLRELVSYSHLLQALNVTDEEIGILSAIPIDGVNKDGYVQLLIAIRAVRP